MILTVEETSIVNSVNHESRRSALMEIVSELPMIRDEELKRICKETADKLKEMTDADFDNMDFAIDWKG